VTSKYGIVGLKVAMEAVGLRGGLPRPPLQPLSAKEADDVRRILRAADIGAVTTGA
jgi:dihydrodipicolinate synthase/N-acetylneuraminate lyase